MLFHVCRDHILLDSDLHEYALLGQAEQWVSCTRSVMRSSTSLHHLRVLRRPSTGEDLYLLWPVGSPLPTPE